MEKKKNSSKSNFLENESFLEKWKSNDLNVILVDDEHFTRKSTLRLINNFCKSKNLNINIVEVEDGISCLYNWYEHLKKGLEFSFILSDECMNYMNGSFCAKILGEIQKTKNIKPTPFYIVTAFENLNSTNFMDQHLINGVFTKPLNFNNLEKIIIKCKKS